MEDRNTPVDIPVLLAHAVAAAREAAAAVLEVYDSDFAVEHKDDKSPLTLADKRSHEVIVRRLSGIAGCSLPILSEEGKDISYEERKKWDYYWLVDPLDGTKEFVKRNGEFTVNIALIHRDRPVLGVIQVPVADRLYYAWDRGGAWKEERGSKIKLPVQQNRSRFTIAGSRSHATDELAAYIEAMKKEQGEVDLISAGSSLKFCLVAEGRADVYPRFGPTMEWDTAAGQIIVEASGGSVRELERQTDLRYNKENLLNPHFIAYGAHGS